MYNAITKYMKIFFPFLPAIKLLGFKFKIDYLESETYAIVGNVSDGAFHLCSPINHDFNVSFSRAEIRS